MAQVNVSLSDELKAFVDQQVAARGYRSTGEYLRELVRRQRDKEQLRQMLLDGAASPPSGEMDDAYFEGLRQQVRARAR